MPALSTCRLWGAHSASPEAALVVCEVSETQAIRGLALTAAVHACAASPEAFELSILTGFDVALSALPSQRENI